MGFFPLVSGEIPLSYKSRQQVPSEEFFGNRIAGSEFELKTCLRRRINALNQINSMCTFQHLHIAGIFY